MLTDLKQANKPAPAPMDTETSLAHQYHKIGMKRFPSTRPDCLSGSEWGQPQEKALLLLLPALGAVPVVIHLLVSVIFPSHGTVLP